MQFYNLLGIANNNPISIHILKIKCAISLKEIFKFSTEELNNLNEIYRIGIQFPFKNVCRAEIELTPAGVKLYNSKYLNRPEPIRIIDNRYFFECSFDQLLIYFISFGSKMNIISPSSLAKKIYKDYKEFVISYEKDI